MAARLSLAQQLAQLDDTAPVDFDPEELPGAAGGDEDAEMKDAAAGRGHYLDVGPSNLRKQHDSISDPKYEGKRASRAQLLGDDDEEEDEEDEGEDADRPNAIHEEDSEAEEHSDGSEEHGEVSEDDGMEDEENTAEGPDASEEEESASEEEDEAHGQHSPAPEAKSSAPAPKTDDLTDSLRKNREADVRKGKAVARQVAIWDTLLDARIRLQKSVTAAQKLVDAGSIVEREDCGAALTGMLDEALALSDELMSFQEKLLEKNEDVTPPARKRRRIEAPEPSVADYSEQLRGLTEDVVALEHTAHPHLVRTLTKWSAKIQAVAPSVLLPSSRNAFSKSAQPKSAVALIDETLADHNKLLARTRVRRGRLAVEDGDDDAAKPQTDPAEIFDDTDFYQQLLRQVIDARGGGAADNQDWVQAQKARKARKKVDTKASKGRKIRYDVHEKLQNFMVPIPAYNGWHEEQVDELFASLLGRGYEGAMKQVVGDEGVDGEVQGAGTDRQKEAEVLHDFRVF
ncbi:TRAUB-domain-containing protein [Schizophyllum commune H4-8]|nr:TRAUB-domain-containing protein [Schizophyllum commune H4-8]KAI5894888.1 TRAUB-domain-containing protein [Schizophyllum commune H4-8]